MKVYIKWSVIINAVFVVIVPNITLIFLNGALIYYVKRRSFLMMASVNGQAKVGSAAVANGKCSNGWFKSEKKPLIYRLF